MASIDEIVSFLNSSSCSTYFNQTVASAQVTQLPGGLVNFVYRVRLVSNPVIIKYYPPYIASSPSVPFSQERYEVEKTALQLFGGHVDSEHLKVPRLLFASDEHTMLVMEDAGDSLMTLLQYLSCSTTDRDPALMKSSATELRAFLSNKVAKAHSPVFANKAAWDVLNNYVFGLYSSMASSLVLEQEAEAFLASSRPFAPPADGQLIFGDLWPNSIMVDSERHVFWLLDWEMTRMGNTTSDLYQLMANLWVMKQNPALFDVDALDRVMSDLQEVFLGDRSCDWRAESADARNGFVVWVLSLVKEKHWQLSNPAEVVRRAIHEVQSLTLRTAK
eukprot:jgi/Mesvir1/19588/Mv09890-RA.1